MGWAPLEDVDLRVREGLERSVEYVVDLSIWGMEKRCRALGRGKDMGGGVEEEMTKVWQRLGKAPSSPPCQHGQTDGSRR